MNIYKQNKDSSLLFTNPRTIIIDCLGNMFHSTMKPLCLLLIIVPSGAPLMITVAERRATSLLLTWQAPRPELRNGIITMYSVVARKVSGYSHVETVTANTTQVEIDGLSPHTNYVFKVAASNSKGNGPYSPDYFTHTAEDGMCMGHLSTVEPPNKGHIGTSPCYPLFGGHRNVLALEESDHLV